MGRVVETTALNINAPEFGATMAIVLPLPPRVLDVTAPD